MIRSRYALLFAVSLSLGAGLKAHKTEEVEEKGLAKARIAQSDNPFGAQKDENEEVLEMAPEQALVGIFEDSKALGSNTCESEENILLTAKEKRTLKGEVAQYRQMLAKHGLFEGASEAADMDTVATV